MQLYLWENPDKSARDFQTVTSDYGKGLKDTEEERVRAINEQAEEDAKTDTETAQSNWESDVENRLS